MSSVVEFIAAAAIVALFGGFLLAGVLTTQPSEEPVPAAASGGPGTLSPAGSLDEGREAHTATLPPEGYLSWPTWSFRTDRAPSFDISPTQARLDRR